MCGNIKYVTMLTGMGNELSLGILPSRASGVLVGAIVPLWMFGTIEDFTHTEVISIWNLEKSLSKVKWIPFVFGKNVDEIMVKLESASKELIEVLGEDKVRSSLNEIYDIVKTTIEVGLDNSSDSHLAEDGTWDSVNYLDITKLFKLEN